MKIKKKKNEVVHVGNVKEWDKPYPLFKVHEAKMPVTTSTKYRGSPDNN